jgi:peroxiredoxin
MIASDLAELQDDLRRRNTELVLVAYGEPAANRKLLQEHALSCTVLRHEETQRVEVFRELGTPAAYLVDEEGRVAEPLALGAEEVPPLARLAAGKRKRLPRQRDVSDSRIERNGLAVGTAAPPFVLPAVTDGEVALADYRGRRVLLVFSDPDCGPCHELAPQLARLQRELEQAGGALVMVSRGELEQNRRTSQEHQLGFPVVLQEGWKLSKQYGIFATPVAFLVDQKGVIAEPVARGVDEILALARSARAAGKEAPIANRATLAPGA